MKHGRRINLKEKKEKNVGYKKRGKKRGFHQYAKPQLALEYIRSGRRYENKLVVDLVGNSYRCLVQTVSHYQYLEEHEEKRSVDPGAAKDPAPEARLGS